jgi:hypothetical protein
MNWKFQLAVSAKTLMPHFQKIPIFAKNTMQKGAAFLIFWFWINIVTGQILVINELDCDTPGIDDKEFVEIKSQSPHFSLDGYVLVFFNGSTAGGNSSYLTLDLSGYSTDVNGLLLIGSASVVPFPQYLIPVNVIQNGADAVAIYQGSTTDFPDGTVAFVNQSLVDVLLYDTNDPDAVGLISIFQAFKPDIQQISEGPGNNTNSIQRANDGTYFVGTPTPRRLNDGSGILLNGLLSRFEQTRYDEGQSFTIQFNLDQPVSEALTLRFSLSQGAFNAADFSGDTTVIIPSGQSSASTTIHLTDDDLDEGDEIMIFRLNPLPANFLVLNNNVALRCVDNDYRIAPFGTPLQPTYGLVQSTQSPAYYNSLHGLSGQTLRLALQQIIANPQEVRAHSYVDLVEILKVADQNPLNSNQIWMVYRESGLPKLDFQSNTGSNGVWNREHTFPRSRGGFNNIDADTLADGIDLFWHTNADSLRHANSDAHGIRAVSAEENNARGNKFYGQYNGPVGTQGRFKGDVARSIFFLCVRYNGLEVVSGFPDGIIGQMGHLDTLLNWHRNDPPDDYEMNRNNVVFEWQRNRNPFIDLPDLAEYIWGNRVGEVWQQASSSSRYNKTFNVHVFPNPAGRIIHLSGLSGTSRVELYSSNGTFIHQHILTGNEGAIELPPMKGTLFLRISSGDQTITRKIQIH